MPETATNPPIVKMNCSGVISAVCAKRQPYATRAYQDASPQIITLWLFDLECLLEGHLLVAIVRGAVAILLRGRRALGRRILLLLLVGLLLLILLLVWCASIGVVIAIVIVVAALLGRRRLALVVVVGGHCLIACAEQGDSMGAPGDDVLDCVVV